MIATIIGYVLVGYLVSAFVSVAYGIAMNSKEKEKFIEKA